MIVTINAQVLANEVRLLSRIAATKPTIPVLAHLLLRAEDQLYLSATDLELAMISSCGGTVAEMGEVTLPAQVLLDILDKLPEDDVTITNDIVTAGGFRSKLGTLPTSDFPKIPEREPLCSTIKAAVLQSLIERTRYAISKKTTKFVLDGAFFALTGEAVAMVATDGKRLTVATGARVAGEEMHTIIPSKTLDLLAAQNPLGDVEFSHSVQHLFFQYGKRLVVSRKLDGEFPKYQRVIPRGNDIEIRLPRQEFAESLRRVGVVNPEIKFLLTAEKMWLSAVGQVGSTQEAVPIDYNGPDFSLRAPFEHIVDFLERANEKVITMKLKDGSTPMLLTDGVEFINVVIISRG